MLTVTTNIVAKGRCLAPRRRWHQCRLLAGEKVRQKYRRAQIRKIQRQEYRNLKRLIPSVKKERDVDKMTVLEEAVKYIDQLHTTLIKRFTEGGLAKHVVPAALPIIQLLESGQLPMPPALQQPVQPQHSQGQQPQARPHPLHQILSHVYSNQQRPIQPTIPHMANQTLPVQASHVDAMMEDKENIPVLQRDMYSKHKV